jgi:hypothetical protein
MSDSAIASRFAARSGPEGQESEEVVCDNLGCFGWLRGIRDRALMIELRKKTGVIQAIGYPWIERMEFDPSEGITLHLTGRQIKIRGKHLNGSAEFTARLFTGLTQHRVPWIQEMSMDGAFLVEGSACRVESIEW